LGKVEEVSKRREGARLTSQKEQLPKSVVIQYKIRSTMY